MQLRPLHPQLDYTSASNLLPRESTVRLLAGNLRAELATECLLRGARWTSGEGASPVQGPTRYTMTINLKTAKTFGLTIASGLIASADEVIE